MKYIYDSNDNYIGTAPGVIQGTHVPAHVTETNLAAMLAANGWHEGANPNPPSPPETEAERAARLALDHGTQVGTLVAQIAQFGLTLPIEFNDAVATMYSALETQPELTRHAMLAQTIYTALHGAGLSDRDIYLISEVQQ